MRVIKLISLLIYLVIIVPLIAEPEDLEIFIDFENIEGLGDFSIGEPTRSVHFFGFKVESDEGANLARSGSKALILEEGEEGKIVFDRGINLIQFYAAETTRAGRIELRDKNAFLLHPNGLVEQLPKSISLNANPPLQSFVAFSGDIQDIDDLNYTNGIKEIKIKNVTGRFILDDLGYSHVIGPPDNVVYEDFEKLVDNPTFRNQEVFSLGQSPVSASFTGGIAKNVLDRQSVLATPFNHTYPVELNYLAQAAWVIPNDTTGTIIFETPAAQVQFYAALFILGDGIIRVFDSNDNLLVTRTDIPRGISIESDIPFTFIDLNAEELGAASGIGRITYTNGPQHSLATGFDSITIDDIGFTPISQPFLGRQSILVPDDLIVEGSGEIVGTNISHPNGNIFDQVLLTGESVKVRADTDQISRVSFLDLNDDIVQVEFFGSGLMTVIMDPDSFTPPAFPVKYNQEIAYVQGRPRIQIEGADASTFISIFTVGKINAVNQNLFPPGVVYDAVADVSLLEVVNSLSMGGILCSNTRFSASKGKVGIDARDVPIAVRLTVGEIDAIENAFPYLMIGEGSFTVNAPNPGLRLTGGNLRQSNGASVIVAPGSSSKPGFDTLISQNNFKSDNTSQPTQSISTGFINEEGADIFLIVLETTVN